MTELFLKIEAAEQFGDEVIDYRDTLCELSNHDHATFALVNALINSVIKKEEAWNKIEQRVDYQAKYQSRQQAREDFLKEYFRRK